MGKGAVMDIVVLAGGLSPERDVSLSSGSLIANALMEKGHRVLLLDLYRGLEDADSFAAAFAEHAQPSYSYAVPPTEPDLTRLIEENGGRADRIGPNVLAVCASADITFLALHGDMGENGQLQAVFDVFGIRYTGTGYEGSLLAMNKAVSKELMEFHGISTPEWVMGSGQDGQAPFLPCVVKPVGCGSSIGVSIVETEEAFQAAVGSAMRYEESFLVERKVEGREFSIGVLDGEALPAIEILPADSFYSYESKYQQGGAREVCPAEIGGDLAEALAQKALAVHRILHLGDFSRVDFIVDRDGCIHCLEANTLPGMTPTSLLPQEAAALGISYADLCDRIVQLALR